MSTETNGTTGVIEFGGPGVVTDAVTWISLAKRLAGGSGWASILEVRTGSGATSGGIGAHGIQLGRLYGNRTGAALTVGASGTEWLTTSGWVLQAFAFPAAGASLGRWHRHEFGVGTTHGNGDNSLAQVPATWTKHYMGGPSDPVQARFAMGGFLRGLDMSDAQFNAIVAALSTAAVAAIAPAGSAVWDASDDFATNLINPGTFDRVAITGATHDVADNPAGWVYGLGGGGEIVDAAAALTGSGTLSATPARTRSAAAVLSAQGTLTATPARQRAASVSLAGVGALSASAARTRTAAASLDGIGSLIAVPEGGELRDGAASLQGAGVLSASAARSRAGRAALSAQAVLTGQARSLRTGRAVLAGVGTLHARVAGGLQLGSSSGGAAWSSSASGVVARSASGRVERPQPGTVEED